MKVTQEQQNKLILDNMRLIYKIARNYKSKFLTYDDLVQEGVLGMIKAVQHYKEDKGKFGTYAYYWVAQQMGRAVKSTDNTIRIPECVKLASDYNEQHRINATSITSLDKVFDIGEDTASPFAESFPSTDNTEKEVETAIASKELKEDIKKFLNDKELYIIDRQYGIWGKQMNLVKLGMELKTSSTSVANIKKQALDKLKVYLQKENYFEVC